MSTDTTRDDDQALEEFAEKLKQSLKYHYVTHEALSSSEELVPDVSPDRYRADRHPRARARRRVGPRR